MEDDLGLTIGPCIGSGRFAKVHVAHDVHTGEKVAVKVLSQEYRAFAEFEVQSLAILDHPNILQLQFAEWEVEFSDDNGSDPPSFANTKVPSSISEDTPLDIQNSDCSFASRESTKKPKTRRRESSIMIVTEYAEHGTLLEMILKLSESKSGFDEVLARTLFQQLIAGLREIHSKHLIHRDIKPENLLICGKGYLKIADFGLACRSPRWPVTPVSSSSSTRYTSLKNTRCGSHGYLAPEMISGAAPISEKVDIFAAGIVLFQMLSSHSPFHEASRADPLYELLCHENAGWKKFWSAHEEQGHVRDLSGGVKDLLSRMFQEDPEMRPTIEDIENSAWFMGPVLENKELRTIMKSLMQ